MFNYPPMQYPLCHPHGLGPPISISDSYSLHHIRLFCDQNQHLLVSYHLGYALLGLCNLYVISMIVQIYKEDPHRIS